MAVCFSRARTIISAVSIYYGACAFNFNCKTIQFTVGKVSSINIVLRGLFEGAVYSRARSITLRPGQSARSICGRELNKGAE